VSENENGSGSGMIERVDWQLRDHRLTEGEECR
jgi:hypothetical protein